MAPRIIRQATPADYDTFADLFRELGVEEPVPSRDGFCEDMLPTVLIAEVDGRTKAYAFFRPMKEVVHLSHIVTDSSARGEGHAHALMTEVARRARTVGCTQMTLNVRTDNDAAIRVYERFGLRHSHYNHGLKIPWAVVEALGARELADEARAIAPTDDAALEAEWRMPLGALASQRARHGRVLRRIATKTGASGLIVLDVASPNANPFRMPDLAHGWALLLAVRSFALPEHRVVHMLLEDQPDLARDFVAAGATLKMTTTFMRGAIGA